MNAEEFTAELQSSGFTCIETKDLPPRPANTEHAHEWRTRGLVLSGEFVVVIDDQKSVYLTGNVFDVAAAVRHREEIGPQGARILVGRRQDDDAEGHFRRAARGAR